MHVLIIAPNRNEFDSCVATYDPTFRAKNQFHHVTRPEQMRGYTMPLQVRFVGDYRSLPDVPELEALAKILTEKETHAG